MSEALPDVVLALIDHRVRSLAQVEILLLRREPHRLWSAADVGRGVRTDAVAAARELARLADHALVTRAGDTPAYRYAPVAPVLDEAVEQLRVAYETRPATLIRALYERPAVPSDDVLAGLRSFADSFRGWKPGP